MHLSITYYLNFHGRSCVENGWSEPAKKTWHNIVVRLPKVRITEIHHKVHKIQGDNKIQLHSGPYKNNARHRTRDMMRMGRAWLLLPKNENSDVEENQ